MRKSEKAVYLVEVKSTPRKVYLDDFLKTIENFKLLFPEFGKHQLILIFASLRFDEDFLKIVSSYSFYALAYRKWDYMDILNFDDLQNEK